MLRSEELLKINRIFRIEGRIEIEGQLWSIKKPIFDYPSNSGVLDMWELNSQPEECYIICDVSEIKVKMLFLSLNFENDKPQRLFTMPLSHCWTFSSTKLCF